MQLSVLSFVVAVIRQCYHCSLLFINILATVLLFLRKVVPNLSFRYKSFITFVTNPHYSFMVVRKPLIYLAIYDHSITRLGSLGFQLSLWDSSNRVIIWFSNLILTILLLLLLHFQVLVFILAAITPVLFLFLY